MQKRIYEIVNLGEGRVGKIYSIVLATVILLNVIIVFLGTFKFMEHYQIVFTVFDVFTAILFTLDYLLRIWIAPLVYPDRKHPRLKYMTSFLGVIDLISILPFYISNSIDLRTLRLLRVLQLMRILKLSHFSNGLREVGNVLKTKSSQLVSSILVIAILIVIAASLMYEVESAAQPDSFTSGLDALWWAVATLTTVGYGDIYPVTGLGRLLSAVIALLGIGIVAVPSGIIAAGFTEQDEPDRDEELILRIVDAIENEK